MGVLTGRLPLLLHSAGSTGALRHPNPPVTSEDREDGGSGGVGGGQVVSQEVSLLGSKCGKAEKIFSFRSWINIFAADFTKLGSRR